MSQELTVSALQGQRPDAAFAALDPSSESLADGIGAGYGVLGYKGKVWTLRYRGEKHTFVRPDDGTTSPYIDVIVLRNVAYKSKSYYPEGSFTDGASEGKRPMCSALDGLTPDADAMVKQAPSCSICPRNEWKTSADGKKGRECTDYKRLAVLLLPSVSARLFPNHQPLMEPVFLRVPAGSLTELGTYGENLKTQGWHYSAVVTRVGFDPNVAHPKMTFKAIQALTAKEAPVVLPLRNDALAQRITGESEIGKPRPVTQIAAAAPALASQPVNLGGFGVGGNNVIDITPNLPQVAQPAQQVQQVAPPPVTATVNLPPPEPTTVETGFGAVGQEQPVAFGQVNSAADAPLSQSDEDLDALIAAKLGAMLPK